MLWAYTEFRAVLLTDRMSVEELLPEAPARRALAVRLERGHGWLPDIRDLVLMLFETATVLQRCW